MKSFSVILAILFTLASPGRALSAEFPSDGVYFSFEAFRASLPGLVKNELHRELDKDDFTIRQWISAEQLYYVSGTGMKLEAGRDSVWGYVENGIAYIHLGKRFHKITTYGSICYFLESYPVIKGNPAPVITETKGMSAYRLLDMETGDLYYYTPEDLGSLLERDEKLYAEFTSIENPKERKKKMFLFLEKYNKLHPLNVVG
jgi:hypothetical protein